MDYETILRDSMGISEVLLKESREVTAQCREMFDKIDAVRGYNQLKVLQAFRDAQIAPMHFAPTYGYGYSDAGREKLEELFAAVFRSEDAIVRPQIASGTHALAIALYGLLRGGDSVVSLTGEPYDTLADILGTGENKDGSLMQMGVHYTQIELKNGKPDMEEIVRICSALKPRVAMLQRSRGYSTRASITVEQMKEVFE
ncbi:MAG: methionine gamma-lyase family protein, partial [Clostridiales bacterium]|nr:methionine gamma-lyase family protein [Clostridiales bacterium]